ncbi:MAG: hypothetical protein KAQ64_00590 [Candidatus Pacebacteria bacterium]|nr:hypothetical protein [Candidatus Paceibacterota bacterium]
MANKETVLATRTTEIVKCDGSKDVYDTMGEMLYREDPSGNFIDPSGE